MPLKNVQYQRLETDESEDEAPPAHVQLNGSNHVQGTVLKLLFPINYFNSTSSVVREW